MIFRVLRWSCWHRQLEIRSSHAVLVASHVDLHQIEVLTNAELDGFKGKGANQ
jgi:hypothetical protein